MTSGAKLSVVWGIVLLVVIALMAAYIHRLEVECSDLRLQQKQMNTSLEAVRSALEMSDTRALRMDRVERYAKGNAAELSAFPVGALLPVLDRRQDYANFESPEKETEDARQLKKRVEQSGLVKDERIEKGLGRWLMLPFGPSFDSGDKSGGVATAQWMTSAYPEEFVRLFAGPGYFARAAEAGEENEFTSKIRRSLGVVWFARSRQYNPSEYDVDR